MLLKWLLDVDHVEGYLEPGGDTSCISHGLYGAAPVLERGLLLTVSRQLRLRPETQHDSYHVIALLLQQSRRYRAVYTSAHPNYDSFHRRLS